MNTLVIGGAASGKSEWAEAWVLQGERPLYYLATMLPSGRDNQARITRHRQQRADKGFITLERAVDLAGLTLPARGTVLLECMGNLVANELFQPDGAGDVAPDAILRGISRLAQQCNHLVVVSNDVFADGITYPPGTQCYVSTLAAIHAQLSRDFDQVVEVVCGIPLFIKQKQSQKEATA